MAFLFLPPLWFEVLHSRVGKCFVLRLPAPGTPGMLNSVRFEWEAPVVNWMESTYCRPPLGYSAVRGVISSEMGHLMPATGIDTPCAQVTTVGQEHLHLAQGAL